MADRNALFSRLFGNNISRARDLIARGLVRVGVSANLLTFLGLIVSILATPFLALGAGSCFGSGNKERWYGIVAAFILIGSSAFDMLDGAVAKLGHRVSRIGSLLDSCCDRVADGCIFLGIAIYYFRHPLLPHSLWFAVATIIALIDAESISYVKARAENFIPDCQVGFWQRGERIAAILIGLFCGHIATVMVLLAISSFFTALRRLRFAISQIRRQDTGQNLLDAQAKPSGIYRWALWRYRRGSLKYDLAVAFNIAIILFIDLQQGRFVLLG